MSLIWLNYFNHFSAQRQNSAQLRDSGFDLIYVHKCTFSPPPPWVNQDKPWLSEDCDYMQFELQT